MCDRQDDGRTSGDHPARWRSRQGRTDSPPRPPVSARTSARRTPRNDRAASAASAPGRARAARPRAAPSAPDGRCSARPGNRVRRPQAWRPERQRRIQDTSDSHTCCRVYPRSAASLRPGALPTGSPPKGNAPVLRVIRAGSMCLSVPPDLRVAEHAHGRASCASAFARRMGAHVERRHRRPASLCVGRRPQHSEQFLLYRVFDALTDSFFPLLARIDDEIDELEAAVLAGPTDEQLQRLFAMKRELVAMRKVVTPPARPVCSLDRPARRATRP